jgi:hypothetical protein
MAPSVLGKTITTLVTITGRCDIEDVKVRNDYIWGASIVEILLGKIIELWKIRNDEVHGITEEIQEKR